MVWKLICSVGMDLNTQAENLNRKKSWVCSTLRYLEEVNTNPTQVRFKRTARLSPEHKGAVLQVCRENHGPSRTVYTDTIYFKKESTVKTDEEKLRVYF